MKTGEIIPWCVHAVRKAFGHPSAFRVAPSIAAGVALGVTSPACATAFVFWLAVILVFRTHLRSVLAGVLAGLAFKPFVAARCEAVGMRLLRAHEEFWREMLGAPVICYFQLEKARMMGALVLSARAFAVALVAVAAAIICYRVISSPRFRAFIVSLFTPKASA